METRLHTISLIFGSIIAVLGLMMFIAALAGLVAPSASWLPGLIIFAAASTFVAWELWHRRRNG